MTIMYIIGAYLMVGTVLQIVLVGSLIYALRSLRELGDEMGNQSVGEVVARYCGWNMDKKSMDWATMAVLLIDIVIWPRQIYMLIKIVKNLKK